MTRPTLSSYTQKWFYIQNLPMDLSFQEKNNLKIRYLVAEILNRNLFLRFFWNPLYLLISYWHFILSTNTYFILSTDFTRIFHTIYWFYMDISYFLLILHQYFILSTTFTWIFHTIYWFYMDITYYLLTLHQFLILSTDFTPIFHAIY